MLSLAFVTGCVVAVMLVVHVLDVVEVNCFSNVTMVELPEVTCGCTSDEGGFGAIVCSCL